MLALGCLFQEPVTLTLTEALPAGAEIVIMPVQRMKKEAGVRIAFEAPPSVSITRESAKCKERKARPA